MNPANSLDRGKVWGWGKPEKRTERTPSYNLTAIKLFEKGRGCQRRRGEKMIYHGRQREKGIATEKGRNKWE